jgi:hypothetical protein
LHSSKGREGEGCELVLPTIDLSVDTKACDLRWRTSLVVVIFALRADAVAFKGAAAIGMMSRGGLGTVSSVPFVWSVMRGYRRGRKCGGIVARRGTWSE